MTIAITVVLAIWFALSVMNQIPAARRFLTGTLNSFNILPSFALFAPDPADVDYHLVYRDHRADGSCGEWLEIVVAPGGATRALWNPTARDCGALLQAVAGLSILSSAVAPRCRNGDLIILVSLPYLLVLNLARAAPRTDGAVARQFAIVESTRFGADRTLELGIASPLHALT